MDHLLRCLLTDLEPLGATPDEGSLASIVQSFVADEDYWRHHIDRAGGKHVLLHGGQRGPQVALAHRCNGTMSYVHSHRVWVALAPVAGAETHRRYAVTDRHDDMVRLAMTEERVLRAADRDVVTLLPPDDIHNHGHQLGSGDCPYTVIVLGDDQLRFDREEFDLETAPERFKSKDSGLSNWAGSWLAEP